MSVVTVSQKGWVVIPAELRRRYGWKPGTRIHIVEYAGFISLHPVLKNPEEEGWGASKLPGRSLLKALKDARKEERKLERRREKARR